MSEEELEEIIKIKDEYIIAQNTLNEWLDYVYDKKRTRYSDDYYPIKIEKEFNKSIKLHIHLPTLINAMEKYTQEKLEKYKKALKEIKDE